MNDKLTDPLERLVTVNRPTRTNTENKSPTFDGKRNVEYLKLRVTEVSTSTVRSECSRVLHLGVH